MNSIKQTSKRCSSTSPITAPPHKSPRTDFPSPSTQTLDAEEGHSETVKQERQIETMERPSSPNVSPTGRRKSWRRATLTRRSLPALPNPYQGEMFGFLLPVKSINYDHGYCFYFAKYVSIYVFIVVLCRGISTSLSSEERLEKLMETSMRVSVVWT